MVSAGSGIEGGRVPGISSQCSRVETWVIHPLCQVYRPTKWQPSRPTKTHPGRGSQQTKAWLVEQSQVIRSASLSHDSLIVTTNFGLVGWSVKLQPSVSVTRSDHFGCMRAGESRLEGNPPRLSNNVHHNLLHCSTNEHMESRI